MHTKRQVAFLDPVAGSVVWVAGLRYQTREPQRRGFVVILDAYPTHTVCSMAHVATLARRISLALALA